MTQHKFSHYAAVSRRTALSGALGAALLALAACSNDDSSLPSTATSTSPAASQGSTGTAAPTSSSTPSASASARAKSGTALPASAALTVSFTFTAGASDRGPARNPYVAVWVESSSGDLVKTVALWHEERGGQDRWLSEMKAFSALNAGDAQTVSSATRQPGSYSVTWDGVTETGARAPAGTYRVFVEAAREHGPYELVQHDVTLGSKAASFDLGPSGELSAARAEYAV